MKKATRSKRKVARPRRSGFHEKVLLFRKSLRGKDRALLDELIVGALGGEQAPALTGRTQWTRSEGETLLRDIGQLMIAMNGGYRTCGGGSCGPFKTDAIGDIYCSPVACKVVVPGDTVAPGCACHLYSYPKPAAGAAKPPMKDWTHAWKPGDPHLTPAAGQTYECVCVV